MKIQRIRTTLIIFINILIIIFLIIIAKILIFDLKESINIIDSNLNNEEYEISLKDNNEIKVINQNNLYIIEDINNSDNNVSGYNLYKAMKKYKMLYNN